WHPLTTNQRLLRIVACLPQSDASKTPAISASRLAAIACENTRASDAANRPDRHYVVVVDDAIRSPLVAFGIHDPVTFGAETVRQAPVGPLGASGNARSLDPKGPVVDPARRRFGAGGQ